jgi:SynChlorMet cassette protein ScmD
VPHRGKKPIANPFVLLREEFDDWAILFNPDSGHGFGLSPTGVYLWKLLDGEHTLDSLVQEISRFTAVPEEARDHLVAFVDELIAEGLAAYRSILSGLPHNPDKAALPLGSRSPGPLSAGNMLNYEPPKLVNLSGERATGACSCCSSGTSVGADCNSNGACAGSNCWPGTCASQLCLTVGNSASSRCCTGNSPGWAQSCEPGNCPQNCGDCFGGHTAMCYNGDYAT